MIKALRSTVCCVMVLAICATAPGLAPYAAAGEMVAAEVRGAGAGPVVSGRAGIQTSVLPSVGIRDLSRVTTIPGLLESEAAGINLSAIPANAALIQTGIAGGLTISPEAQPTGPTQPEARADALAPMAKEVAPGLQLIAEPKSSGESSSRAGEDITTILQGGRNSASSESVEASAPQTESFSRGRLARGAAKGSLKGAFFGAGILSLGTVATGGLAAGLIVFPLMIASFVLHEVAHARVAYMLGDPGPMLENRGSLKPRDWGTHFDWLWTFVVPMATFLTARTIIGGAKPVEFDSSRFKKTGPIVGAAIAGFAGPAANLVLAGLGALAFAGLGAIAASGIWVPVVAALSYASGVFAVMNAAIAAFNLMPFYPLDGHFVFNALLPKKVAAGLTEFYHTAGPLAWVPFVVFMGGVMKLGLLAMAISWLSTLILGGAGAAALHLASAALPAAAGLMIGRMRDNGVPALAAQPQVAEHRFMKERLAQVRSEMSNADDGEWKDSLERQADGYAARVNALETQYPALRGK